ncbi:hypothetical protein [Shewanella algicola]|uniref:hypothetical protein n=1 Tax=Shewanella algicola TaxID=640633 RepID=UPI002494BB99|nr:hypothetical protein [Shewanella algicola]
MKFEIEPHIGVGPIKFGMNRQEVEACFGKPEFDSDDRVGFMSGFLVDFDSNGKVEFIELANSRKFDVIYRGVNLHSIKSDDVVTFLEKYDAYDKSDAEVGHSYIFKILQLSLWRRTVPADDNDADGQHFDSVGIACGNYFE